MAAILTKLSWKKELEFTGKNGKGFETQMDGNTVAAPSPMELLLESIGGCSAIDVVMILQKMREPLERLEVRLEGDRNPVEPKYYTSIRVQFDLWGSLSAEKVMRAINLSFAKYCSVFHSLRKDLKLIAEFRVNASDSGANSDFTQVEISFE